VAATVSVSSEPAHVASDMILADTKPERSQHSREAQAARSVSEEPTEPTQGAVEDGLVVATSDAVTAPLAGAATAAGSPEVPGDEPPPTEVADETSDGVIRHHIATAETAPVRRRPPGEWLEDDRPGDATGEITMRRQRPPVQVRHSEPSILVADLAVVRAAVSGVADEQTTTPTVRNAASPAHEAPVAEVRGDAAEVRGDAAEFSDADEAFFRAGHEREAAPAPHPVAESFDDLDEGYRPVGFWERLRGKPPPKK
jgi:hypothetical protein